jgi:hypothetical protein
MQRNTVVFLFLLATPLVVQAHAIRASVAVTESQIVVVVSFDGEDDLRGDVFVWLEDEHRSKLDKVKLSGTNTATFPRPADGTYLVVAEDDGFGHRVEKRITIVGQQQSEPPQPVDTPIASIIIGWVAILVMFACLYHVLGRFRRMKHGP